MNLPYITNENERIGGEIKTTAEFFQVTEIPTYLPSGEGQHIYINITRSGLSTKEVISRLCKLFNLNEKDIGAAGLKDKHAKTTQWLSLSLGATAKLEDIKNKIENNLPELQINKISKHSNKLKTGHLIGNHFKIVVTDTINDALPIAIKLKEQLSITGIPNFYGPQRFGSKGDNHIQGKEVLLGNIKCKRHWMKKLYLSAIQSDLFNKWLAKRIKDNNFCELIEGDDLVKSGGGRSFPFSLEKDHLNEFKNGEISYTGPMFGNKVKGPTAKALEEENQILFDESLSLEDFAKNKLPGARREARIFPQDLEIKQVDEGIEFSFTLSSGSYATSVLREFIKS